MRWSMPRNAKKRCVAVRGRAGGGRPSRRATERPDGRPGGRTTAWGPCNRAAGRPDDRAAGLPGGSAVGRPSGWAGGRAGERAGGRPGGRAAGQGQAAKRPSVAFDVSVTRFCSCVFFKWQWLVHKLVVTHWRGLKKPLLIRRTLNSTPETMHASFRNAFTAAVNHGPAPGMQLRAKPFQTSTTSGAERF